MGWRCFAGREIAPQLDAIDGDVVERPPRHGDRPLKRGATLRRGVKTAERGSRRRQDIQRHRDRARGAQRPREREGDGASHGAGRR